MFRLSKLLEKLEDKLDARFKSWLARNANNYFGMTGSYNGQKVYKTDRYWRKYSSMEESFNDHGRLLSSGRYAQATKGATSADAYIDAIQPIYAPESDGNHGISKLWKTIIKQNNLTQYDTGSYSSTGSGASGAVSRKREKRGIPEAVSCCWS